MPPPNRRCRQLVVSGGYAAYDSSLPAKTTAATPDKMIVAAQVQTRREGLAEITSGRACAQQGLTATCKDLLCEAIAEAGGRATGLAHEPVGAMKWE
jgi:hypothetical protein